MLDSDQGLDLSLGLMLVFSTWPPDPFAIFLPAVYPGTLTFRTAPRYSFALRLPLGFSEQGAPTGDW